MAHAAAEAPAAYVLAAQFHDTVRQLIEELDDGHDYLAVELLRYSERIMGNVGAAEAPYAGARRQLHYQIAFRAICGCAAASELVTRLRLAPTEPTKRARRLLSSLASLVRPIAEKGMEPRGDEEEALLDSVLDVLQGTDPWQDPDEEDEEAW